jgi:hypothetical protein
LNQQQAHDHSRSNAQSRGECANHLVTQYEELAEIQVRLNRPNEAIVSLSSARAIVKTLFESGPDVSYLEARVCCKMIGLLSRKDHILSAAQKVQRGELVRHALDAVRKCFPDRGGGFKRLKEDKIFDPLRTNAEFQLHLLDLAFPSDPLAR